MRRCVPYDAVRHTGRLPRLPSEFYRGRAVTHWVMAIEQRATGWLDAVHHARWREWLTHVSSRYALACPVYCLMPDHAHLIWMGWSETSDQRQGAALLRKTWNAGLKPGGRTLQRQAYDHVLRERERERGALMAVCGYVLENPVRAGLVARWQDYAFSGALVPGCPSLDPREETFWPTFWRIFTRLSETTEDVW